MRRTSSIKRDVIIRSVADLAKVKDARDRREIRHYIRFLKLWPVYGYDMLQRPFWQRYLNVTPEEASRMTQKPVRFNNNKNVI